MLDWAVYDECGITASPCIRSGARARYPNLSCTSEGKAQQRRDPSERAGSSSPWMTTVTRLSWFTSVVVAGGRLDVWARRSGGRVQHCADRHHTGVEITPQRHHELACHRHDGDPPDAPFDVADPLAEPGAELAVRLMAEPQQGDLDRGLASATRAGCA